MSDGHLLIILVGTALGVSIGYLAIQYGMPLLGY